MAKYAAGLDYGTNSVRCVIANVSNGREVGHSVWNYRHGRSGVILTKDPNLARQHPGDYVKGTEAAIKAALASAKRTVRTFKAGDLIGIGVDTTGSTPMPVDCRGQPLAFTRDFARAPDAMAWLWKDHTSVSEAEEITSLAARVRPHYLAQCGGTYSSEWFFSKILHCLRTSPKVFESAYTWVELADWIPAMLTGTEAPDRLTAGICAAGHKGMYSQDWGGYPDERFLAKLDPRLAEMRRRLPKRLRSINTAAGGLSEHWAKKTGLYAGIPVAVGALDAHLGGVGAGIGPGTLVKIIGTSTCDMMVVPIKRELANIPGLCGIVPESILPGHFGLEAGQSAVGDIFNWFVDYIRPQGRQAEAHKELTKQAARLRPGESGLLALDWNNGNRTVLADQRLTGLLVGQTLYTTPAEIYRALIEATAFGALKIISRFEQYGVRVRRIVNCGGVADKNPMLMQIYADVTGREMMVSRSNQTCALGAAIAGAVVAGKQAGGFNSFRAAQKAMTGTKRKVYRPQNAAKEVYKELYEIYAQLHDAFGTVQWKGGLHKVMKQLIDIRVRARQRLGA